MEVRKYSPNDYFEISVWWKNQGWPGVPQDHLPETGFVVEGIASGFLYKTDSKIAWLEFIIANPSTTKEERSEALDLIIDKLLETAKELNFKNVFSTAQHPKLLERYQKHGFTIGDQNMTNLMRSL